LGQQRLEAAELIAEGQGAVGVPLAPAGIPKVIKPGPAPAAQPVAAGRQLQGRGEACVAAPREAVWAMLLDPAVLMAVVPGAHAVERVSATEYRAEVTLGVGPVKGRYRVRLALADLLAPSSLTLSGRAEGALGFGHGQGRVTLREDGAATVIAYQYEAQLGGRVASIAGRLLDGATRLVIAQFFAALARQAEPPMPWWRRLWRRWA
jgi:2-furoyl-CoA dehydrogenase large subunit